MKNQITTQIETDEEINFSSSETVQVGFTTDKNAFLQIAKSIESITDECTFLIDEEGLTFRGMDPQHVAMIDLSMPNSCFEKWSCIESKKFAVNISDLRKLITSLDSKGSIHVIIEEKQIRIRQNGFEAFLKSLEPSATDCPLPRIPYDSEIIFSGENKIDAMSFKKMAQKIAVVSDYMTVKCNDGTVIFSGKGDNGEGSITYSQDDCKIQNREDSETTYSLEYLIPFLKTLQKDSEILFGFSSIKPLRVQTKINNIGRVDFYLAPRVEN